MIRGDNLPPWNDNFHKAEAGQSASGVQSMHSADFLRIVRTLDILVRRLLKDDAPDSVGFKEELAKLGENEKRLLSTYLLAAAEFYHNAKNHEAMIRSFGLIELLEKKYGINVNRYDHQSN